ncbi:MAG: CCA tRNA nucleotidyltransferase [Patescibacteria group bacterium]
MKFFKEIFFKKETPEDKLRKKILTEPSIKRFLDDLIENQELDQLELYLVGGIVRDTLLGAGKSKDYDFIFRKISREELESALTREKGSLDLVGRNFGVYKFMPADSSLKEAIDIAFPRVEYAAGTGGYRDFEVQADPNLPIEKDLGRRDLTINAMAYDVREGKLIDPFSGQKDLENKIIRAVGDPNERFKEDYSRILRAIRFACKFDFEIEPKTWQAIIANAKHLNDTRKNNEGKTERIVPEDTIRKEMLKALEANPTRAFDLFDKSGVFEQIVPELSALKGCEQPPEFHYEGDTWEHTKLMLGKIESPEFKKQFPDSKIDGQFVMAMLLHDIGKPATRKETQKNGQAKITFFGHDEAGAQIADAILRRLRFPKKQIEQIKFLIERHMTAVSANPATIKNTTIEKYFMGPKGHRLLMLFYLDSLCSLRPDGSVPLDNYNALVKRIRKINAIREKQQHLPAELLDGMEIMEVFMIKKGGPWIKAAKEMVREEQLAARIYTKEEAAEFLLKNKKQILGNSGNA